MRKRANSPAGRIRTSGLRVSNGPWTVYIARSVERTGRLIVALGRVSGTAVTRSRIRRIARDVVFKSADSKTPFDILLVARSNIQKEPRGATRQTLQGVVRRAVDALAHRQNQ